MTDDAPGTPRTHERWFPILALVAVATMVNYLDRTVLGIAAPYLTRELGLSAASLGIVFSAFSWSYALLQIPGGIFLDRFGTRSTYSLALTLWSAFTALMGRRAGTCPGLVLTRIGVGHLRGARAFRPTAASSPPGSRSRSGPAPTPSIRSASTPASRSSACRCSG